MADQGDFSFKHTGNSQAKTDDGRIAASSNWEGTATGFGTVFGTLCVPISFADAGATSGPCTWVSQAFLDDGTRLLAHGTGTWEEAGQHKWKIGLDVEISNGDRLHGDGEIDLATRIFSGTFHAA